MCNNKNQCIFAIFKLFPEKKPSGLCYYTFVKIFQVANFYECVITKINGFLPFFKIFPEKEPEELCYYTFVKFSEISRMCNNKKKRFQEIWFFDLKKNGKSIVFRNKNRKNRIFQLFSKLFFSFLTKIGIFFQFFDYFLRIFWVFNEKIEKHFSFFQIFRFFRSKLEVFLVFSSISEIFLYKKNTKKSDFHGKNPQIFLLFQAKNPYISTSGFIPNRIRHHHPMSSTRKRMFQAENRPARKSIINEVKRPISHHTIGVRRALKPRNMPNLCRNRRNSLQIHRLFTASALKKWASPELRAGSRGGRRRRASHIDDFHVKVSSHRYELRMITKCRQLVDLLLICSELHWLGAEAAPAPANPYTTSKIHNGQGLLEELRFREAFHREIEDRNVFFVDHGILLGGGFFFTKIHQLQKRRAPQKKPSVQWGAPRGGAELEKWLLGFWSSCVVFQWWEHFQLFLIYRLQRGGGGDGQSEWRNLEIFGIFRLFQAFFRLKLGTFQRIFD